MDSHRRFSATVSRDVEVGGYVAQCVEVDVASQGESVEEALDNLREALELYFEEVVPPAASDVVLAQIDVHLGMARHAG